LKVTKRSGARSGGVKKKFIEGGLWMSKPNENRTFTAYHQKKRKELQAGTNTVEKGPENDDKVNIKGNGASPQQLEDDKTA